MKKSRFYSGLLLTPLPFSARCSSLPLTPSTAHAQIKQAALSTTLENRRRTPRVVLRRPHTPQDNQRQLHPALGKPLSRQKYDLVERLKIKIRKSTSHLNYALYCKSHAYINYFLMLKILPLP